MKAHITKFLRRHVWTLILLTGLGVYVIVAGTTRSCPACAAVTDLVGLSSSGGEVPKPTASGKTFQWSAFGKCFFGLHRGGRHRH